MQFHKYEAKAGSLVVVWLKTGEKPLKDLLMNVMRRNDGASIFPCPSPKKLLMQSNRAT
ncbi:MAG: hypothetical protein JWQ40_604 [Segetibacter sp.]|jgi:hypothetical protein|nr:hypothetical protein [Segetibacter sp.]